MIQRIQTLFLLTAAALLGLFLALNGAWAHVVALGIGYTAVYVNGAAYVLAGLATALALVATFLYKDRPRQSQVIGAAMVADALLALLLVGAMAVGVLDSAAATSTGYAVQASVSLLPIAAYLVLHLARRGVKRDIALVRSMDRLR